MHFSSKYVIQDYVIEIFEYIWSLFPPQKRQDKNIDYENGLCS